MKWQTLVTLAAMLVSCMGPSLAQGNPSGRTQGPVFNEATVKTKTPAEPSLAVKKLGELCDDGGQATCETGLCLKTGSEIGKGHVCSTPCADAAQCPESWSCRRVMPGPHGGICIPPAQWTSRPVEARP